MVTDKNIIAWGKIDNTAFILKHFRSLRFRFSLTSKTLSLAYIMCMVVVGNHNRMEQNQAIFFRRAIRSSSIWLRVLCLENLQICILVMADYQNIFDANVATLQQALGSRSPHLSLLEVAKRCYERKTSHIVIIVATNGFHTTSSTGKQSKRQRDNWTLVSHQHAWHLQRKWKTLSRYCLQMKMKKMKKKEQ